MISAEPLFLAVCVFNVFLSLVLHTLPNILFYVLFISSGNLNRTQNKHKINTHTQVHHFFSSCFPFLSIPSLNETENPFSISVFEIHFMGSLVSLLPLKPVFLLHSAYQMTGPPRTTDCIHLKY